MARRNANVGGTGHPLVVLATAMRQTVLGSRLAQRFRIQRPNQVRGAGAGVGAAELRGRLGYMGWGIKDGTRQDVLRLGKLGLERAFSSLRLVTEGVSCAPWWTARAPIPTRSPKPLPCNHSLLLPPPWPGEGLHVHAARAGGQVPQGGRAGERGRVSGGGGWRKVEGAGAGRRCACHQRLGPVGTAWSVLLLLVQPCKDDSSKKN